ncbi:autotransporter domain-containing protein [Brevundimonas sp. Root1423]|uniref:autotransporter domain-containing protein n=1 Tax=Brevundimonas sp. Root1423 TaxID=1736462 RepID=UPI0006FFC847|nr:autotransporter domain-containing protein [Brevundimonas sp. Root1423]KQY91314.1 hypothetical protein ASD25_19385 [Brevundimonas sp. Root1423]
MNIGAHSLPSVPANTTKAVASRRAGLLAGVATFTLVFATAAQAQVAVQAREGRDPSTAIELSAGNDRLSIDISRVNADGDLDLTGLATGINDPGGSDSLWLTATGVQTRNLLEDNISVDGFENGVVYEAYGADSVLTLNSPASGSYDQTLRLAGNGTINLAGYLSPIGTTPAIYVEELTTAGQFDGVEGRLNLILSGTVVGVDAARLIDVSNAATLSLVGADIDLRDGIGIYVDGQSVTIDEDSTLRAVDSSATDSEGNLVRQNAILVHVDEGSLINYGTLQEMGDIGGPGSTSPDRLSTGVLLNDGTLTNSRRSATSFARITMHGNAVDMEGFRSTVLNDGHIESTTGTAIVATGGHLHVVRNGTAGVISGATNAYRDLSDGTDALIVNAGVMNGNVRMGDGADMFLTSADAAGQVIGVVNGLIDGGSGDSDAFGLSYSAAGNFTHALPATINGGSVSGFERYGVEAFDAGTIVTITGGSGAGPLTHGLSLSGNGRIINQAHISLTGDPEVDELDGIYVTGFFGALDFENSGVVRTNAGHAFASDGNASLKSFSNTGEFWSQSGGAGVNITSELAAGAGPFIFSNSGAIRSADSGGVRLDIYPDQGAGSGIEFLNTGQITGAEGRGSASVDAQAVAAHFNFANTGAITGGSGAILRGDSLTATNSGTVDGFSVGSVGLSVVAAEGPLTVMNSGMIRANGGGVAVPSAAILSAGLGVTVAQDENADATNAVGGTIEATGILSVAVFASGRTANGEVTSTFALSNSGTIRGSGQDTTADELYVDNRLFTQFTSMASAIQTFNTLDAIINDGAGLIVGNVDLADGADRFEARGASVLQGDLRMGSDADTLVWAGGSITGTAFGGADDDTLLIDLSADRTINFDFFREFETVRQQTPGTTGILTASGTTDLDVLLLDNITMRVAAGTTLASAATTSQTIQGSDNSERLIVEGAIEGDISMGGGDDRVDLAGGSISGFLDGGDGDDTLGFRIDGVATGVPMAMSFEILDVVGTAGGANDLLDLTLDSDFNEIRLREGANLTLSDGGGTAGLIRGDDGAQLVTILDGARIGGVSLGGGSDTLNMEFSGRLSDVLDGGEDADGLDNDTLNLTLTGATTFGNGAAGFEQINIAGSHRLTVDGLFAAGQALNFLGDDNHLVIDEAATFAGSAHGGEGDDTLTARLTRTGVTTISGSITGFEDLVAEGGNGGVLALTGAAYAFDSVTVTGVGGLTLGANTSLAATNGVTFNNASSSSNILTLGAGSSITGRVDGGEGGVERDILRFVQNAGEIGRFGALDHVNFEQLEIQGAGEFQIDVDVDGFDEVYVNAGTLVVNTGATLGDDVRGGVSADTVRVHGVLAGNISLAGGADTVDNRGVINGDVLLGDGNDFYIARDGGVVNGDIDGGDGDNTFVFRLGGNPDASIPGNVRNFNSFGVFGTGTLNIALNAGQNYARLALFEGANLVLDDNGGTVGSIIGDDTAQEVTIGSALVGGVELNGGDDTLNLTLNGALSGDLNGGTGTDRMNLTLAGDSSIADMNAFEDVRVTAADNIRLTVTGEIGRDQSITFQGATNNHLALTAGAVLNGSVNGGDGTDRLEVETGGADQRTVLAAQIRNFETLEATGSGSLVLNGGAYGFDSVASAGGLTLGENVVLTAATVNFADNVDNTLVLASGADIQGAINGGEGGLDTLSLIQAQGFTRALSSLDQTGFERLAASGAGALVIDQNATFAHGVSVDGGRLTVNRGITLTADVTGGAGADVVEALGIVDGDVSLGAGNDSLALGGAGSVTGTVDAGDGIDTLTLNTAGTYAAPTNFSGAGFSAFENLEVAGGVVSLTANQSWRDVNVNAGRLIGQAGTTLTSAERIDVAVGATFGSAGIVNGNINVLGTLSPGASPGTMTVNGNVTMAAGSHLAIELTPTAGTDLLDVNGTLTIADGATMDITGALGNAAGSVLDIVVADTITGRFTTVNKSETVFGFVVQNGNRIQIRSEFNNSSAYPTNVQASVDYANQVLRASYGVQAFTGALNVLTAADGTISQPAFAALTPEAYGSAVQIGVENGLSIVDASRTIKLTTPMRDGLYAFGQGLFGSAEIEGQRDTGAASADMDTRGFFAGMGYGMGGQAQVGAFVGQINTDQSLSTLGATTDTDGYMAGLYADAVLGGVGVHGLIAWNGSDATTTRDLAVSSASPARADYGVTSWTADLAVDYAFDVGGTTVTPRAGLTYMDIQRDALAEQGAGAFALAVQGDSNDAWFADAGVAFSGTVSTGGAVIRPYAELGVRQMLTDADVSVVGRFGGAPGAPITVSGVERGETVGRYGFGFSMDLGANVEINAGYTGQFKDADRSTFTAGMSMRF